MVFPTFTRCTAVPALLVLTQSALAHLLTGRLSGCTEFVGVTPVVAALPRSAVPLRQTPIQNALGARLVVRVADCASVRVGAGLVRRQMADSALLLPRGLILGWEWRARPTRRLRSASSA